jgi:hypothetical protein
VASAGAIRTMVAQGLDLHSVLSALRNVSTHPILAVEDVL